MRKALLLGALALALPGCKPGGEAGRASLPLKDGGGVVLVFDRRLAVWVSVRASAEARSLGWKEGVSTPVFVTYPARGFNPAFTGGARLRVAWVDGERIIRVDEAAEVRHVSPPQEVTGAILLPEGVEVGLQAGDRIRLVEAA